MALDGFHLSDDREDSNRVGTMLSRLHGLLAYIFMEQETEVQ